MNLAKHALIRQTALLSAANVAVRAMGFLLRILTSRLLGAQAVGVMELASSTHMLCIAPVTSGLPMAMSRLCAREGGQAPRTLRSGLRLALLVSLPVFALAALLSPLTARLLGDARTFPALAAFLPCIPVLGVSAALNGYFYGRENALPPALSELCEQLLRLALTVSLLLALPALALPMRAAVPALATFLGEGSGLALMLLLARRELALARRTPRAPQTERMLVRLALPMTAMRLVSSAMRTVCAALVPARLQLSGLPASEAIARFGMLQGMAMPVLMMPSVFTGALAMVVSPAIARRQRDGAPLRPLARLALLGALGLCIPCAGLVWALSPAIAQRVYRQMELLPLLRFMAPMVALLGVHQVVNALLAGLGIQRRALYGQLAGSLCSLALAYALTARPQLRLYGYALATMAGHALTLLYNLSLLRGALRGEAPPDREEDAAALTECARPSKA